VLRSTGLQVYVSSLPGSFCSMRPPLGRITGLVRNDASMDDLRACLHRGKEALHSIQGSAAFCPGGAGRDRLAGSCRPVEMK